LDSEASFLNEFGKHESVSVADVGNKIASDCGEIPAATFQRRSCGEPADVGYEPPWNHVATLDFINK
jgi:hypothetical protein